MAPSPLLASPVKLMKLSRERIVSREDDPLGKVRIMMKMKRHY